MSRGEFSFAFNLIQKPRVNAIHGGYKREPQQVCALQKGDVETPNDFSGVVYIGMDENGAWKNLLAGELKDAGYNVDMNKMMPNSG